MYRYSLGEVEKIEMKEIIEAIVEYTINHKHYDGISLDSIHISPAQVMDILEEELGYEKDDDWDSNGWEGDSWWYFSKDGNRLCLFYSGYSFTMTLSLEEPDEEDE